MEIIRPDHGGYEYLTSAMIVLGDVSMAQGDLAGARRQFEESLQIRKKMGEQDLVAESQVSLADLSIEENHPEQAEPLLREAIVEFEKENATPDEISVYVELSRVLRTQEKLDEAAKTIAHADELSHGSPDPALKLPLAIEQARVRSAKAPSGAPGRSERSVARHQLHAVISRARKLGYYNLECEARLAEVELDRMEGASTVHSQAAALEVETQKNGFLLLSKKASLLASNGPLATSAPESAGTAISQAAH